VELVPNCVLFLACHGVWLGKPSGLRCICFIIDDSLLTMLKNTKQCAVVVLLMHENETPIRIHLQLLAFYGDVNLSTVPQWVRK
jgi:hypothetical protein